MASKAAKRGFSTENRIINAINSRDELGKKIIKFIEKSLNLKPQYCHAERGNAIKADIKISYNSATILISVKEFSVTANYNHIERKPLDTYAQEWHCMSPDVYDTLKLFVGEVNCNGNPISINNLEQEAKQMSTSPGKLSKQRRKKFNQMSSQEINAIKSFFEKNKHKILKNAFLGTEDIKYFIIAKNEETKISYYILPAKPVLSIYENGSVDITRRGNLKIGNVTLQRKGGDHKTKYGRKNKIASHLQFKIRPSLCISNNTPIFCEIIKEKQSFF